MNLDRELATIGRRNVQEAGRRFDEAMYRRGIWQRPTIQGFSLDIAARTMRRFTNGMARAMALVTVAAFGTPEELAAAKLAAERERRAEL